MTRVIYPSATFETNGDCSSFQINFNKLNNYEINELREKLKSMGFPVYERKIDEPKSIIFSILAMGNKETK